MGGPNCKHVIHKIAHKNENEFVWWLISKVLTCHVNTFTLKQTKNCDVGRCAAYIALNLGTSTEPQFNLICAANKRKRKQSEYPNYTQRTTHTRDTRNRRRRSERENKYGFSSHERRTQSQTNGNWYTFVFRLVSELEMETRKADKIIANSAIHAMQLVPARGKSSRQQKILIYGLSAMMLLAKRDMTTQMGGQMLHRSWYEMNKRGECWSRIS